MPMRGVVVLLLFASAGFAAAQQPSADGCDTSAVCSQMANEAIARSEFETAHDLAWRAVQRGSRNDVALMYLLARTQSLSGRPRDALVMLNRLAALGFRSEEIETLDEFRRVRALPEWTDLRDALRGVAPDAPAAAGVPDASVSSRAESPVAHGESTASGLPIPSSVTTPLALAYDAVSDRFVVADESSDTLKIVDERTGNVVDLVRHGWSGAYQPSALAIDSRRGDLWAAGVDVTNDAPRSALYKLQLVSGRLLQTIELPSNAGPVRVVDLAIGRGTIFLLDAAGRRVFALPVSGSKPRVVAALTKITDPIGIAAAGDTVLYVAHAGGLARIDLTRRGHLPLAVPAAAEITDLQSIRWHDGSLFAIRRDASGTHAATRIRLDARGTVATALETLGPAASRATGVYAGVFYYVASDNDRTGMVLRGTRAR